MKKNKTVAGLRMAISLSLIFMTGCSVLPSKKTPISPLPAEPATIINADIRASTQVNPDNSGRASPVVVRLYELKTLATFNSTDFSTLYNDDATTLGADLVKKEQFVLRPGGNQIYNSQTDGATQYIGIVAAYRDLNESVWRRSSPVPAKRTTNFAVILDALGISIQVQ